MSDQPEDGTILRFPDKPTEFIIGPFTEYRVIIEGRQIPGLTALAPIDGRVTLLVDGRFAAEFNESDARQAAWLIANALAIGAGYSHAGAETKDHPFAPRVMTIGSVDYD